MSPLHLAQYARGVQIRPTTSCVSMGFRRKNRETLLLLKWKEQKWFSLMFEEARLKSLEKQKNPK